MNSNLVIYIVIALSVLANLFLAKDYFERNQPKADVSSEQTESVVRTEPYKIPNGIVTENSILRKYQGSSISGAILIPVYNKILLIGTDAQPIYAWTLSDNRTALGAKLLKDGSVAYINKQNSEIKIVDINSQVRWELKGTPTLDHFHPHLWAFDEKEEMYYVRTQAGNLCPYIVRMDREKKMTWWAEIPKDFCNVSPKLGDERNRIGVFYLDYVSSFVLTQKPALAVSTGEAAFVFDIESKKVVWQQKKEGLGVLTALKFQKDGSVGRLVINNGYQLNMFSFRFSAKQNNVLSGKPAVFGTASEKMNFFDLDGDHILFTDGNTRFFELNVPLEEGGDIKKNVLWSYLLTSGGIYDQTMGSDYVPEVPEILKQKQSQQ